MTRIEFGYGKGKMTVDIPEKNLIASLRPRSVTHNVVGEDVIRKRFPNPSAPIPWETLPKPGKKS